MGLNQTAHKPWNEAVQETIQKEGSKRHSKHKAGKKPSATKETNAKFPVKDGQKEMRNEIPQEPFAENRNKTVSLNEEVGPIMVPNTKNSEETEQWVQNLWREIRENKL